MLFYTAYYNLTKLIIIPYNIYLLRILKNMFSVNKLLWHDRMHNRLNNKHWRVYSVKLRLIKEEELKYLFVLNVFICCSFYLILYFDQFLSQNHQNYLFLFLNYCRYKIRIIIISLEKGLVFFEKKLGLNF